MATHKQIMSYIAGYYDTFPIGGCVSVIYTQGMCFEFAYILWMIFGGELIGVNDINRKKLASKQKYRYFSELCDDFAEGEASHVLFAHRGRYYDIRGEHKEFKSDRAKYLNFVRCSPSNYLPENFDQEDNFLGWYYVFSKEQCDRRVKNKDNRPGCHSRIIQRSIGRITGSFESSRNYKESTNESESTTNVNAGDEDLAQSCG